MRYRYPRQRSLFDSVLPPWPAWLDGRVELGDAGCWLSIQVPSDEGYAKRLKSERGDGTSPSLHRHVWERLVGDVPAGLQLDHLCRVRHCCNPAHLEPVTNRENVLRGIAARRFEELNP